MSGRDLGWERLSEEGNLGKKAEVELTEVVGSLRVQ
jgi:hypothetical protein